MSLPGYPEAAPLAGLAGGVLIGLAAALMLLALGRIAGVSGLVAKAVLPEGGHGCFCSGYQRECWPSRLPRAAFKQLLPSR